MQAEQHDVVRERATGEPRAGAARHEAHAALGEQAYDGDRLVARAGKDGERRAALVARQPVGLVRPQLAGTLEHTSLADDGGERAREPLVVGPAEGRDRLCGHPIGGHARKLDRAARSD